MRYQNRISAFLLAVILLFSAMPVNALAAEADGTGGLCEHHPAHTAACGYAEGVPGAACIHEHTADCYIPVTACIHEHTNDCYPVESAADDAANPPDAEGPAACAHVCGEESGCVTQELNCTHQHDEGCGYAEGSAEAPCAFVCEICRPQDNNGGTAPPAQEPPEAACVCEALCTGETVDAGCPVCGTEGADLSACAGKPAQETEQQITVTGFAKLPEELREQPVAAGTALEALRFPDALEAYGFAQDSGTPERLVIVGVRWEVDPEQRENKENSVSGYDPELPGPVVFTPVLPEAYTLAEGAELPEITVLAAAEDGPQFLAALRAGGPITVSTFDQFMAALQNGNSPITVDKLITLIDGADSDGRVRPIFFPDGTEVVGNGPESMLACRSPIQLEGDVTFRNIGLVFNSSDSLGSVPHREIFLAGHALTLDNVNTYLKGNDGSLGGFGSSEEELLPTVYAGGYRGTSVGSNASLTIQNANSHTMFKAIHMGHDAGEYQMAPYTGDAKLELDARTLSREGVFTDQNSSAAINITAAAGSSMPSVRISRFTGSRGTTLTLDGVLLLDAQINGVGTVSLAGAGTRLGVSSGSLGNVVLPADTSLSLTGLGNAVIDGNFAGGGRLELDPAGSAAIKGKITGTTTVVAGDHLSPQPLTAGKAYITGSGAADAFQLYSSPIYDQRFSLDYVDGRGWVASQLYTDTDAPEIGSIEILSAPTAVNVDDLPTIFDPDKSPAFQIVWRADDQANTVISSSTVYDEGFFDDSYTIILKSAYLSNDSQTDWLSGLMLDKAADDLSDFYYLYNAKSDGTGASLPAEAGNYTILLLSDPVDIYDLSVKTIDGLKAAIAGKVLAQATFDVYEPSSGAEDLSTAAIAPVGAQAYTGRPLTPAVTVTHADNVLSAGTDYVVSYADNIQPGKATVTVTGIGKYSGVQTALFQIVKAEAGLSLTVNGSSQADAQYGDTLRFVFQAAPKKTNRAARSAAPNTVAFVCGDQVLGTAAVGADGQAVLSYKTTDRKLPIGESKIGVRFGGSTGLNPSEQEALATVTLRKAALPAGDIASVSLKDFAYDGTSRAADLLYATLANGDTVYLKGSAELDDVNAGTYSSAKVLRWEIEGSDANWYALPSAPGSIKVEPPVHILKKEHPAPADQYITAKPGEKVQHSMDGVLPPAEPTSVAPDATLQTVISYQNGVLTVTAPQSAGNIEGTVTFTYQNYQTVAVRLHITVADSPIIPPAIQAADTVFNGQPYSGLSGSDLDKVDLLYRDLDEQKDLNGPPTAAGHYSVTAEWSDGTTGVTSVDFSIAPLPITVQASDRTIPVGEPAPELDAPVEGQDYTLSAQPVSGYPLGKVRMDYKQTPATTSPGRYEILIAVENPDPNYQVSTKSGYLTVSSQAVVPVHGVSLDRRTLTLTAGGTARLSASVQPADATEKGLSWKTDNAFAASVDQNGLVTGVAPGFARITVTTNDGGYTAVCEVMVQQGGASGGGGGGGGGGRGSSGSKLNSTANKAGLPAVGSAKPVSPDASGSVTVSSSAVQSAISAAKKNSSAKNGISVTIPVAEARSQSTLQVTIQAKALDTLIKENVQQLAVTTEHMVSVGIGRELLKRLDAASKGGDLLLQVQAKPQASLSQQARSAIGARPVYDLSLAYLSGGKKTPVTSLGGQRISVRLPYAPAQGERPGNLYAVYVDGAGRVQWLTRSAYDMDQKAVVFDTSHLSIYGVGYKNTAPAYADIAGHWAADSIRFAAGRGLFPGVGKAAFSPDASITRGMLVTALGRLAGINPDSYRAGRFTDVPASAYYAPYVNWAAQTGVAGGTTASTFSPDAAVTREQMAVILASYTKRMGYDLPAALNAAAFADSAQISSGAKSSVKAMQQAGILAGKDKNRFDPKTAATRAEAAAALQRLVEVSIDPQAANGWMQNHSGQWIYYKNGVPAKG